MVEGRRKNPGAPFLLRLQFLIADSHGYLAQKNLWDRAFNRNRVYVAPVSSIEY